MDAPSADVGQYYLQVQALTPLEAAQGVSAAEPPAGTTQQVVTNNFLPIVFFIAFVVISMVGLLSHRILKLYGYSRSLGMLVVAFAILVGGYNIREQISISSLAGPNNTPEKVAISQVTSDGFVIEWETNVPTTAYIQLQETDNDDPLVFTFVSQDEDSKKHRIEVQGLLKGTTYQITVYSSNEPFGGADLIVTTQ